MKTTSHKSALGRRRKERSDNCPLCGMDLRPYGFTRGEEPKTLSEMPAAPGLEAGLCECAHWARVSNRNYLTHHHPNCPRYNDSLMTVWEVTDGASVCVTDNEQDAREEAQEVDSVQVIESKMHREVFEHLPEFEGF